MGLQRELTHTHTRAALRTSAQWITVFKIRCKEPDSGFEVVIHPPLVAVLHQLARVAVAQQSGTHSFLGV